MPMSRGWVEISNFGKDVARNAEVVLVSGKTSEISILKPCESVESDVVL